MRHVKAWIHAVSYCTRNIIYKLYSICTGTELIRVVTKHSCRIHLYYTVCILYWSLNWHTGCFDKHFVIGPLLLTTTNILNIFGQLLSIGHWTQLWENYNLNSPSQAHRNQLGSLPPHRATVRGRVLAARFQRSVPPRWPYPHQLMENPLQRLNVKFDGKPLNIKIHYE